tara:strand:+ start:941 stop:1198 length:258 start_codon:yes stop_codon:yes gene_type:complete
MKGEDLQLRHSLGRFVGKERIKITLRSAGTQFLPTLKNPLMNKTSSIILPTYEIQNTKVIYKYLDKMVQKYFCGDEIEFFTEFSS